LLAQPAQADIAVNRTCSRVKGVFLYVKCLSEGCSWEHCTYKITWFSWCPESWFPYSTHPPNCTRRRA